MGRIKYNYDKDGYDRDGYDKEGYNKTGFNRKGIHKETGTEYNPEGYDKDGYRINGYDGKGYDREGFNREGYNLNGYDREGYDREGYNREGFNREGINRITKNRFDFFGYDKDGYDKYGYSRHDGYNRNGFDRRGFNREGIHKGTGTEYDFGGLDKNGFDKKGIHIETKRKYDRKGFDKNGFNKDGIHKETETEYDTEGYNIRGYDEQGYNRKGHHIEGYDDEGYDRNGFDRNGVNREGINRKTGIKDDRVEFAEEFISYGKSIEEFARYRQIPIEQVKAMLDEIRTSAIVKERLDGVLARNANRFLGTVKTKKEQLLSGKIAIRDVKGIDNILKLCNPEERKKVNEMLIMGIATHEISVLQYKDIFGIKEINSSLPQEIIMQIESLKRSVGPLAREFYKEMNRMKSYKAPYIPSERETLGYMEKPTDKKPKMVTITDEHRDMARQYLRATDEFICNKTMQVTLMKIVKGEIGIEQIQRAQKESELRSLQQEDGELGELIEQSEQFITATQVIAQQNSDTNTTRE